jgi:hypothetical protein
MSRYWIGLLPDESNSHLHNISASTFVLPMRPYSQSVLSYSEYYHVFHLFHRPTMLHQMKDIKLEPTGMTYIKSNVSQQQIIDSFLLIEKSVSQA